MTFEKKFDVTVIGASISGCFAALLLAREGLRVALLESTTTWSPKACGEGLSKIGQRYLEEAGLWHGSLKSLSFPFNGYEDRLLNGVTAVMESNVPIGFAVQRKHLDRTLLNAAKSHPNVTLITDRAADVCKSEETWSTQTASGQSLRSSQVLISSGLKGRALAGAISTGRPGRGRFAVSLRIKGAWRATAPHRVIVQQKKWGQFVMTPISSQQINICALVSTKKGAEHYTSKKDLIDQAREFAAECEFIISEIEENCGSNAIECSRAKRIPAGIYLVGDAAEIFDAVGGMGMSHALFSASLASAAVSKAIGNPSASEKICKRYTWSRSVLAQIFRTKTWLSCQLNIEHSILLEKIVRYFPRVAARLLFFTESTFPLFGLARQERTQQIQVLESERSPSEI